MAALAEGELVAHSASGLGLRQANGRVRSVTWAPGYSVVDGALRDATGSAVARTGDRVQVGGGGDDHWVACHQPGSVKVVATARPSAT
jgi:hypothetical protein